MTNQWNNPQLAQEYSAKLEQVDWYENIVNMPSLEELVPKDTGSLLDFGCGPGQFTAQLAETYQVVGADAAQAMLDVASAAYSDIEFVLWDGQSIYPRNDQKFDVIFSKLALHFVEDLAKFVQTSRELLTEKGSIVFSVPHPVRTMPKVDGKYAPTTTYDSEMGSYGIHVQMIHRTFAAYTQPFLDNGFALSGIDEPLVSVKQMEKLHAREGDLHMPRRLNLRFTKA